MEMYSNDNDRGKSVDRRRELNRQAAQKLRNRQKEKAVNVKQDYFAAQSRNTQLTYDVKRMRKVRMALTQKYEEHVPYCPKGIATFLSSPQQLPVISQSASSFNAISMPQYVVWSSGQNQSPQPMLICLPADYNSQILTVANGVDDVNMTASYSDVSQSDSSVEQQNMPNGGPSPDDRSVQSMEIPTLSAANNSTSLSEGSDAKTINNTNVDKPLNGGLENGHSQRSVPEALSVPSSPVTEHTHNTRRRRAVSIAALSTEPSAKIPAKKIPSRKSIGGQEPAVSISSSLSSPNTDSLPLVVTGFTDDED